APIGKRGLPNKSRKSSRPKDPSSPSEIPTSQNTREAVTDI
ncbi:MAG: hypothetical protein ACI97B_001041, partial [Verrucomicrobiales bacterium]